MAQDGKLRLTMSVGVTPANLNAVLKLKRRIYRDDPRWVPPLKGQLKRGFSPDHPYNARGHTELFVVLLDGEPVASAIAFFDAESAVALGSCTAYFSGFETVEDPAIAEWLVEGIEAWAIPHGAVEIAGPMSPRMSDPRGVLIEGEGPPVFGMSYNPPYYDELLSELNFRKAMDLFEFILPCRHSYPRLDRTADMALRRFPGLRLRPFDLDDLDRDFRLIAGIYNEAWRANWGFISLDYEDLIYTTRGLKPLLGPASATIVELDGKPIGFQMLIPDLNSPIKAIGGHLFPFGWLRLKKLIEREKVFRAFFIGVVPKYRKTGIEALLIRAGLETGAERVHIGWVLESNFAWKSEIAKIAEGDISQKRYRIYRREIAPGAADAVA